MYVLLDVTVPKMCMMFGSSPPGTNDMEEEDTWGCEIRTVEDAEGDE